MTFGKKARRAGWLLIVAVFAFGLISALKPAPAAAYGLISTRSIKMSSSIVGATNTIYTVGFTPATANQTFGALVIQFCDASPIIGAACTAPTGMNVNPSTLTMYNKSANITNLAISTTSSTANMVYMTQAPATLSGAVSFDLGNGTSNGITNPNPSPTLNKTFYARIMLFSTNNPDMSTANYQATEQNQSNNLNDAGGAALSTNAALNVTAKVQEQLTFCVYTGANCGAGGNAVNLGDSNGVLADTHQTYLDTSTKLDLASNALGGVMVRMKGDTLKSGSFSLDPEFNAAGPNYCGQDWPNTDTSHEGFGLRVVSFGTGQAAAATGEYDCGAGYHEMDVANSNTTYGQNFIATSGATDLSSDNLEFAAKAANTTEAGIYTSTIQFIATATY